MFTMKRFSSSGTICLKNIITKYIKLDYLSYCLDSKVTRLIKITKSPNDIWPRFSAHLTNEILTRNPVIRAHEK